MYEYFQHMRFYLRAFDKTQEKQRERMLWENFMKENSILSL